MVFGICGIALITQPRFLFANANKGADYNYVGVAVMLFASIVNGFVFLVLRKLKDVKASYAVYSYSIGCIIGASFIGFVCSPGQWKNIDYSSYFHLSLLFALGMFGFLGQFFKTKSVQWIPAGIASLIRCTDSLFNYILQI